ncbi:bifunctional diaminohydroxyphosphoribosylaminopyrimidine deaminase/5-amino-6-(5-phosphoribosylamino)uracil reductase RibD [Salinicoccus albus]|uniref:bifunctional diaminohydroxyphosphoribosylaminopyrimidine deaminase/5-amino-6-(5-phosphoribosylamino)uracil reductase RibD n=1 Tax=Salinicoccus albus TaxID=418756 RepID=UPI00036035E7|nr:bifunctional diaminohydroxyphosphoribosylaminopyrimidine deaminase/5-amino-6-(5-phosphoribosylamino)uracil reductase RibD [Salinicoccus albus]
MNRYMKMAYELAQMTAGQTGRNPPVGAVIVKNGRVIGMGAHLGYGEPHAERQALASCTEHPSGADIYVTLEPCSHHGKTPPCTEALIEAGIKHVCYAESDLNPKVSGHQVLEAAGVTVTRLEDTRVSALYQPFFNHLKKQRPNVTLKCAMSADGRLALDDGSSRWITGESSRSDVHQERHVHDAIIVGKHTLFNDDPKLTARIEGGGRSPVPVILLGDGELHDNLALFDHPRRPVIYTSNTNNLKYDEKCEVKTGDWRLEEILDDLYSMAIASVFVEGGANTLTSFFKERLYDQLLIYAAPKIFGESQHTLFKEKISTMEEAVQLELIDVEKLSQDLKITYRKA